MPWFYNQACHFLRTSRLLRDQHAQRGSPWQRRLPNSKIRSNVDEIFLFSQQLPSSLSAWSSYCNISRNISSINWARDSTKDSNFIVESWSPGEVIQDSTHIFPILLLWLFTSVVFKKAAVLAIIFPWVSIAPFGFPERKKKDDEDTVISRKTKKAT